MERSTRQHRNKRRRYLPGFLVTLLWVSSLMAVLAAGGYAGARFFVAPAMLKDSTVQQDKPRPIRILSPDEAAKSARDADSHVWTEGVDSSDIPRLQQENGKRTSEHRRSRRVKPTPERTEAPASEPSGTAESQSPPATTGDGGSEATSPSPSVPTPTAE